MSNLLLEDIEYKIEKTRSGVWRRYVYSDGRYFAEYKSHGTWLGLPLLHYTRGICPETGRRVVARGVLAVGRVAVGIAAIGHAAFGVVAIGQLGLGLLFGLGQASSGVLSVGQLALGAWCGIGQLATGYTAIGQLAFGHTVLAQVGVGASVWSPERADPEAVQYFTVLMDRIKSFWAP